MLHHPPPTVRVNRTPVLRRLFRRALVTVASILIVGMWADGLVAQTPDSVKTGVTTEGKEFWVVFQKNFRDFIDDEGDRARSEPLHLELFITSNKHVEGFVEVRGIGFRREFAVKAGEVINIPIDSAAQVKSSEIVEDLAVHIVADEPIAVYGLSHRFQTTDTYLAYPVDVLGTGYRAMGYKWLASDLLSQIAIVATEDNTKITIVPTSKTRMGKQKNRPFAITLQTGEVYQIMPDFDPRKESDLTGTTINSDKPIAVFSGHNCAYVPSRHYKACNLLVEQMPPLQSWGRQFFVGTLAARESSVLRVLANEDETEVFENNNKVATLAAGDYYENPNLNEHTMLTSSKPVLVAQFAKGFTVPDAVTGEVDSVGDPMMIVVAPTEQFLSGYRFATPVKGSWEHYVNIIAPTQSIGSLRLNERPINPNRFERFGMSRYSIAQVLIPYGTYSISGEEPFGLYSYGFGYADKIYDAYGNGGGQSMVQLVKAPDTKPPTLDGSNRMEDRATIGIVRDDRVNDVGVESIQVDSYDNVKIDVPDFEKGVPQVAVRMRPVTERQNARAVLVLTDRAGNESRKQVCLQYDEFGDTMIVSILEEGESCPFAPPIQLGMSLGYSVNNHKVDLPVGSDVIENPVSLKGSRGAPSYTVGAFGSYHWRDDIHLTGNVGLEFWRGDAFGVWPDSVQRQAEDGTEYVEEFQLHRTTTFLKLSPGVRVFPLSARSFVYGTLHLSVPLDVNERYTRTILSPSNFVYENGDNVNVVYEGDGPGGFPLVIAPEIGIGATVPIRPSLNISGELGAGFSFSSAGPGRDWPTTWFQGRIGVTKIFRF